MNDVRSNVIHKELETLPGRTVFKTLVMVKVEVTGTEGAAGGSETVGVTEADEEDAEASARATLAPGA